MIKKRRHIPECSNNLGSHMVYLLLSTSMDLLYHRKLRLTLFMLNAGCPFLDESILVLSALAKVK